jgi:hypothetical protein
VRIRLRNALKKIVKKTRARLMKQLNSYHLSFFKIGDRENMLKQIQILTAAQEKKV